MIAVAQRRDTIPITCCLDGQAHDITDDNVAAGHDGHYQALCGHLVLAAALAAPVGRPCASCNAVVAAHREAPTSGTGHRSRHRQPGLLRRLLHGCVAGAGGKWWL